MEKFGVLPQNEIDPALKSELQKRGETQKIAELQPKDNFFADVLKKYNFPSSGITFNVGEGLSPTQQTKAKEVVAKPASGFEPEPKLKSAVGTVDFPTEKDISKIVLPNFQTKGKTKEQILAMKYDEAVKRKQAIDFVTGSVSSEGDVIAGLGKKIGKKLTVSELSGLANSLEKSPVGEKAGAIARAKKELLAGTSLPVKIRVLDDGRGFIEDGRHRIEAARQLGIKELPVEDVSHFYNKTGGVSPFNSDKYVAEQVAKKEIAKKGESPSIIDKAKNFFSEVKKKLVDSNAPIEDVLNAAEKGGAKIPADQHITNQIDRVLRSPTIAGQFVRDNGFDTVIKEVDNLDNLDQYLIAKQAKAVEARGIKTGRNLAKDEQLIKDFGPRYEEAAKKVNEYSQKLLDYSVESGLVSKDAAKLLKERYPDYVPINRVFSELEKSGGFSGGKAVASLSKQTVVQSLKGSEREIESPIKSLLEKTADAFKQGEKNKAGKMLAGYKELPGNPFQLRELKAGESAPNTISYIDNGVKRTFETTKDIADAAKALNVQQLNILGQIFALPVRIAKLGITGINLPFIASNVAKDQITGAINSTHALKTSIANPAVFIKSLLEAVNHGALYDEMARNGALGTSFDIARNSAPQTIERIRAGKSIASKIKYTVTHPGELLRTVEDIVGRSEELTRIQQYAGTKEALLKEGKTLKEAEIGATRASRENTVNFARKGEWGQVLNSAFLYLNAGIQGTRTFVRNFATKPLQTAGKIALTVFTPIAAATAWNLSDPERKKAYEDIADYEKHGNIIIVPPHPTKDENGNWNVIKIPLSQEINNIAGLVRRPIEQAFGLDPVSVKDIASALVGSVSPINPDVGSIASTLTPQAIKPSVEAITNTNLYTGFKQVPTSMEKLSPELQVKKDTSGTARIISKALNFSPLKVEAFIKGTLGGVGSQVLNVSDRILAGLKIIPKDQIGGQDTIKAIVARFAKARGGSTDDKSNKTLEQIIQKQADDSFRLKQEAEILYADLKKLPKEEANMKATQIQQKNPQLYEKLKDVVEAEKLGLDYNDRLIKQLQVKNGERAKFIWASLKAFKTKEEKNAYVAELQRKKLVSDEILNQLRELKRKNY